MFKIDFHVVEENFPFAPPTLIKSEKSLSRKSNSCLTVNINPIDDK